MIPRLPTAVSWSRRHLNIGSFTGSLGVNINSSWFQDLEARSNIRVVMFTRGFDWLRTTRITLDEPLKCQQIIIKTNNIALRFLTRMFSDLLCRSLKLFASSSHWLYKVHSIQRPPEKYFSIKYCLKFHTWTLCLWP